MFLGVDGGGTKTACCLVRSDGEVVASVLAPSLYYFDEGIGLVDRVLDEAVRDVCAQAGIEPAQIDYAFFGLPGYGEVSADTAALDAVPRAVLGHHRYACDNDMVCGWAGSLGGADGINVVSGTGSMTYGERAGRGARVGGWGQLFGDEGSAYWIAVRGLAVFSKMVDGRLPDAATLDVFRKHLELDDDLDLVDVVLNRWQGGRSEVAALSRQVVEAARRGDPDASQILADAAHELVALVTATRTRLGYRDDEGVPVSYSGGIFTVGEVLDAFREELEQQSVPYDLRVPAYPPLVGAALHAASLAGTPLAAGALERLQFSANATPGDDP